MNPIKNNLQGLLTVLFLVILGFFISFFSISSNSIIEMGKDPLFIFQVIPVTYWLGLSIIVSTLFFMIPHLNENRFNIAFVFSSIILILCFRMIFPLIFTTVSAFEGDAVHYITVVSAWVRDGVDFGVENTYQHDYPLSYLIAYFFIKLGIPLEIFYRLAPFVIYALNILFLYLIIDQVAPENKKKSAIPALSVFLFSFSSLGYWVPVHYCPELLGSLMFLVSLYFSVKFAKIESWNLKSAIPAFLSIFCLILTHHLCIIYLIFTLFGFMLSFWFFKPQYFKRATSSFATLGVFTYTAWFSYGHLLYPIFFNVYSYFSGFHNVARQASQADWYANLTFVIYPLFIFILFFKEFLNIVNIGNISIRNLISFLKKIREKLCAIQTKESNNLTFVFSMSFIIVCVLFIAGFAVPVLFGTRILEVLLIGLYPLASQTLLSISDGKSRRRKLIILLILLIIIIASNYRYYSQIQRRMIL